MRRTIAVVLVLVLLAFILIGGPSLLTSVKTDEVAPKEADEPRADVIRPVNESGFWPYLNAQPTFEGRSPINVVVLGETDMITQVLVESSDTDWEVTTEEFREADPNTHSVRDGNGSAEDPHLLDEGLVFSGTEIGWSRATGATRYAYVQATPDEGGTWIDETMQVHDGTYYGERLHVRMYESPNPEEPWVAMQAHTEHFDWFTLRHRVHGSQEAQTRLESDFMNTPQVDPHEDVQRVFLGNRNSGDADGWATVVELLGLVFFGTVLVGQLDLGRRVDRARATLETRLAESDRQRLAAARDRFDIRHLGLAGLVVGLVLGVRFGGIALERSGLLSMHAVAGVLYPVLAIGLPAGTYLFAAGLKRRMDAAIVAAGSFSVAIWIDYGFLGVSALPIDLVAQRMLLLVALGLIASGATHRAARDRRMNALVLAGVILWLVVLVATLFGYL